MSLPETVTKSPVFNNLSSALQHVLNISATSAEILVSLLIFIVIGSVGLISYVVISRYLTRWAEKTTTTLDDQIVATLKTTILAFIGILVIQFSLVPLSFLEPYKPVFNGLFLVIQLLLVAYAISKIINIFVDKFAERTAQRNAKNNKHSTFIIKKVVTGIIFLGAFVIILNVFEIPGAWETTFASVSISGIVIAFALQSTLSDLFSAFYIYIDRPLEIGDFIVVGEHSGTVKNIGLLSTRLQLLQGEELVISNKDLSSTFIRNFRKLQKRRIVFNIGVTYDTPNEKVKQIPSMIIDIIKNIKGATPQFVNFNEFGEYSLKFFISYFVNATDYGSYLAVQQQINLAIRDTFEREGIEMAYLKNVTYIKKQ
ncbi:MAG: mechanosensitive ion channel family protein [Nitrososphaerota archaeon]|jgi:small-conductance mechanosensitive channel|nr:mechanosensitive ion channel family protein [Nitrososphaerota archaeon]